MVDQLLILVPGLDVSVRIFLAAIVLGLPLGVIAGYGLHFGNAIVRTVIIVATEVGRGFPALVTLYLVYFGLPSVGIVLDAFPAVVVAFAYTTASYTADIFRSSLAAVPPAQLEAAAALSLGGWATFRFVLWPQAVRIALGPVLGFSIIVFQGTALAYSVGLREIVSRAYDAGSLAFDVLPFLLWAAALYLTFALLLSGMSALISRRIARLVRVSPARSTVPSLSSRTT